MLSVVVVVVVLVVGEKVWCFNFSYFCFGNQKTNSFITISFCNMTFSSSYSMKLSKLCYFKPWN